MKTFKPGDYVRLDNEKIPAMIELLRVNGWKIWDEQEEAFKLTDNSIICDGKDFLSVDENKYMTEKTQLSLHDFLITALRLQEGDGMRSDISTPEQRKHIAQVLEKVGVNQFETYANRNNIDCKNSFVYDGREWSTCEVYTIKTYIDYTEWCRRLNVEPTSETNNVNHIPDAGKNVEEKTIHNYQMNYEESARAIHLNLKEFCDESLSFPNMIADASRKASDEIERLRNKSILTCPDGTMVDLTKPLEFLYNERYIYEPDFSFVGVDCDGFLVFKTREEHSYTSFDHIRNKPEAQFKPGDKVWFARNYHKMESYYHIGVISENGDIVDQDGEYILCKTIIHPTIVDGNPVYPPFNE